MKAKVHVSLKDGVLDPQGRAIKNALNSIGFDGIIEVRQGKYIEIFLEDIASAGAEEKVREMCDKLLVNTVIEKYEVELD